MVTMIPKKRRDAVRLIADETGMSTDTAHSMILMTAALMDLHPDDERVVQMILADCGIEDGEIA